MNKLIVLLFFILNYSISFSSENEDWNKKPLVAYKSGELWHFLGYDGVELFPPLPLVNVEGYSEGLFCVSSFVDGNEKWGFLDLSGKFVIVPQFDKAFPFSEERAVVFNFVNDLNFPVIYSIIDKSGKKINNEDLISALSFSEGLAFVMKKDRTSGYINTGGKFILNFSEFNGEPFSDGFASVSNNSLKSGFINKSGVQKVDFLYESVGKFSEGLASVFKNQLFGFIDTSGNIRIEPKYDFANPFKEGRAFVGYLYPEDFITRWAIIDTVGRMIKDYIFPQVWDFSEGLAAVRDFNSWGFIDKSGEFVITPKYLYTASFVDGLGWASKKEEKIKGYINKKEEYIVILPECERIIDLRLNKRLF